MDNSGDQIEPQRRQAWITDTNTYRDSAILIPQPALRFVLRSLDFSCMAAIETAPAHKPSECPFDYPTLGKRSIFLGDGEAAKLKPIQDTGSGQVQDKERVLLAEIIEKVNNLFDGELTEGDKVTFVRDVLRNKLMENDTLRNQAASNSKEQFANSPDLASAVVAAIMDNLDAHESMANQALSSERVRAGILELLLGPLKLYEALRDAEKAG